MHGWLNCQVGAWLVAGAAWAPALGAQAAPAKAGGVSGDVCALATDEEFQRAQGIDPRIGLIPNDPVATQMVWGPHCDYGPGSIDLFTEKSPSAELERVLALMKATKKRDAVQGLGPRAFFTVIYPDDQYRQRGLLALYVGSRIVTLSMDPPGQASPESTRPKLEALAKLVLPRLE
jgi:hypothetical protein